MVLGGRSQLSPQLGQPPAGQRLHRPQRQAQQAGDRGLAEVLVVAQDQHRPLPGRQPLHRRPQHHPVLAVVGQVALLHPRPAGVPCLQQRPPQQRPVAVDQHLAGVVPGPVITADPGPHPIGPQQGLLGQVLGLGAVAGQQEAQPAQPPVLAGEELPELQIRVVHAPPFARCLLPRSRPASGFTRHKPLMFDSGLGRRGRLGHEGAVLDLHPLDRDGRRPVGPSWDGGDASTTVYSPGCSLEPAGPPPHNATSTSVSRDDPEGGA
jgi:hypothetical protein